MSNKHGHFPCDVKFCSNVNARFYLFAFDEMLHTKSNIYEVVLNGRKWYEIFVS